MRLKSLVSGVNCKLDIKKAVDHVNWDFLLAVLEKMGFGLKWIKWIKWCLNIHYVHGDSLSHVLDKANEGGFSIGFLVGKWEGKKEEVSHLLFVDDIIIFCDVCKEKLGAFELGSYMVWGNLRIKNQLGEE